MVIFLVCLLLGVTGQRYEIKTEKQTNKRKTKEKKSQAFPLFASIFFISMYVCILSHFKYIWLILQGVPKLATWGQYCNLISTTPDRQTNTSDKKMDFL